MQQVEWGRCSEMNWSQASEGPPQSGQSESVGFLTIFVCMRLSLVTERNKEQREQFVREENIVLETSKWWA